MGRKQEINVSSNLEARINDWLSAQFDLSKSTKERYKFAIYMLLRKRDIKNILIKETLDSKDLNKLASAYISVVFKEHKRLYVVAYALFSFLKTFYGNSVVDKLKFISFFKHKRKKYSDRVVWDFSKIKDIIKNLPEPYDLMARIEWETGCRVGATLKLRFFIDPTDRRNFDIFEYTKV